MSGLELAGELLGAFLLGAAAGAAGLILYGRRVLRRKLRELPSQLLAGRSAGASEQQGGLPPVP